MGRRKIEIQPITHERNRSVTFLKRKNGLFKKAYELGVLCSVDVAVIIFETRPGHEVKLHEYSSSDIRNIVHRQTMHQGDTDLKVPADFSGSANKFDDVGDADGDEDIGDEDEDLRVVKPNRRRGQGRLTLPTTDAYSVPLPPPPPPAHHLHPESGVGTLLSANDRVSNIRDLHPLRPSKRPRNARSRSPSEDTMMPALPGMNSEWGLSHDDHGPGRYGRNIRHLHNPPPPPPGLSQQQEHHPQYHSMHQQQHAGHGFQYTPMFPVSNQVSPPPAFIPLHQDFGPSRNLPPFASSRPSGSEGGSSYGDTHQRMRPSDSPSYDPASYTPNANSMIRHSDHHHHHQQPLLSHPPPPPPPPPPLPASSSSSPPPSHRREDRGPDGLFGSLLEGEERNRQRSGAGGSGGLDWPMHDGLALPGRSGPGPTGPRGSLDGPGTSNPANGSDSWFDFLSRSSPVNENHGTSGRKSSSSTWARSSNMDARPKVANDIGGSFEERKESAGHREGVGLQDNPIVLSPKEETSEGEARNGPEDDGVKSEEDKI